MNIKPILFSTLMVQAILAGRKTMTRRVVKPTEYWVKSFDLPTSKYQTGDILWVRETWNYSPNWYYCYRADQVPDDNYGFVGTIPWRPSIFMPKAAARIWLKVTDVRCERVQQITGEDAAREGVAKSQEEMDDDLCNYCPLPDGSKGAQCYGGNPVMCEGRHCNEAYQTYLADIAVDDFATLWDHLNAKRGFAWDSNPYVWVVSFERCEKPESED